MRKSFIIKVVAQADNGGSDLMELMADVAGKVGVSFYSDKFADEVCRAFGLDEGGIELQCVYNTETVSLTLGSVNEKP